MKLSPRQRQILNLLRDGNTYTQAAAQLGLARGTLSSLMDKARRKNGFRSNTDLRRAVQYMPLDKAPVKKKIAGVYQNENGTYRVMFYRNKKLRHVGTFPTRDLAIAARLEAERQYRATVLQPGA